VSGTYLPLVMVQLESKYWFANNLRPRRARQGSPCWSLAADIIHIRLYIFLGSLLSRSGSMVVGTVAFGSERGRRVGGRMVRRRNNDTVLGRRC